MTNLPSVEMVTAPWLGWVTAVMVKTSAGSGAARSFVNTLKLFAVFLNAISVSAVAVGGSLTFVTVTVTVPRTGVGAGGYVSTVLGRESS